MISHFQLPEATCIPWLMVPSPIVKASLMPTSFTHPALSSTLKDPWDHAGQLRYLNSICNLRPPLLCQMGYVQVPGTRL
jgi:hypothetical protein